MHARIFKFSSNLRNFRQPPTSGDRPQASPTLCRLRGARNSEWVRRQVSNKSPDCAISPPLTTVIFIEVNEVPKINWMDWITYWIILEVDSNPMMMNFNRKTEEFHWRNCLRTKANQLSNLTKLVEWGKFQLTNAISNCLWEFNSKSLGHELINGLAVGWITEIELEVKGIRRIGKEEIKHVNLDYEDWISIKWISNE